MQVPSELIRSRSRRSDDRAACIATDDSPSVSRNTRTRSPPAAAAGCDAVAISPIAVTPAAADSSRPLATAARSLAASSVPEAARDRRIATTRSIHAGRPPPAGSGRSRSENSRCVCALTRPGRMIASPRSCTGSEGWPRPTPEILPRSIRTQPFSIGSAAIGSTCRARSVIGVVQERISVTKSVFLDRQRRWSDVFTQLGPEGRVSTSGRRPAKTKMARCHVFREVRR